MLLYDVLPAGNVTLVNVISKSYKAYFILKKNCHRSPYIWMSGSERPPLGAPLVIVKDKGNLNSNVCLVCIKTF